MLHLTGYDLSLDDLKAFRQLHSKTPGHPEVQETPGIEVATGPLGQGMTNGVGLALAHRCFVRHAPPPPKLPSIRRPVECEPAPEDDTIYLDDVAVS